MGVLKKWTHNGTCPGGWFLGNYTLGFEHSNIVVEGRTYLGRWMLYVGNRSVRLHHFYKGDDARAPHDHPWPFWTLPLCSGYLEETPDEFGELKPEWVRGWRLNYRPSSYQHIVNNPKRPFWTLVFTGGKERSRGFWPAIKEVRSTGTVRRIFVPWREWK